MGADFDLGTELIGLWEDDLFLYLIIHDNTLYGLQYIIAD